MTRDEAVAFLAQPMTRERAIEFSAASGWHLLTLTERFVLQIQGDYMFMPFSVMHEAAEIVLRRPVYVSEFTTDGCALLLAEHLRNQN